MCFDPSAPGHSHVLLSQGTTPAKAPRGGEERVGTVQVTSGWHTQLLEKPAVPALSSPEGATQGDVHPGPASQPAPRAAPPQPCDASAAGRWSTLRSDVLEPQAAAPAPAVGGSCVCVGDRCHHSCLSETLDGEGGPQLLLIPPCWPRANASSPAPWLYENFGV